MSDWWQYENLPSGEPYDWGEAEQGDNPYDNIDFHLDLGAGKLPKGRLTIDRHGDADILMDLNSLCLFKFGELKRPEIFQKPSHEYNFWNTFKLPFADNSIKSIISHHCLEHIGDGFIGLMDECYRILEPGGIFRIIVPLFPSITAIEDPDHKRYFTKDTFETFCGTKEGDHWHESFSVPYTKCRFEEVDKVWTPDIKFDFQIQDDLQGIGIDDLFAKPRELRVALRKWE